MLSDIYNTHRRFRSLISDQSQTGAVHNSYVPNKYDLLLINVRSTKRDSQIESRLHGNLKEPCDIFLPLKCFVDAYPGMTNLSGYQYHFFLHLARFWILLFSANFQLTFKVGVDSSTTLILMYIINCIKNI